VTAYDPAVSAAGGRSLLLATAAQAQSTASQQGGADVGTMALPDYSRGASAFPGILNPFKPTPIPLLHLQNSPPLHDLIHNGRLQLSLSEALALAFENNLDLAVQR
jgi:hypothetical protein